MAAAMNGIALHGGFIPYGGTFLVFADYAARRHPALGADGAARHLRDDARLDRPRRGRADAPAGRASGDRCGPSRTSSCSARPMRSRRPSAGRSRWQSTTTPTVLVPVAAEPADRCARDARRATSCARGAYLLREPDGAARRDAARHRLGGRDRARRGRRAGQPEGIARRRRLDALLRAASRRRPRPTAPRSSAPRRASRVEAAIRQGWDRWIGERRRLRRHDRLRRLGAGPRALRAFRHHRGGRRRRRARLASQMLGDLTERTRDGPHHPETAARPRRRARLRRAGLQHQQHGAGPRIMEAAAATDAPVILQASRGARSYAGDIMLAQDDRGARARCIPAIPICMHQDHGNNEATCLSAIQHGFTSVMMDGSLEADAKTPADYDYNVAITARGRAAGPHGRRLGRGRARRPRLARDRRGRGRGRPRRRGQARPRPAADRPGPGRATSSPRPGRCAGRRHAAPATAPTSSRASPTATSSRWT